MSKPAHALAAAVDELVAEARRPEAAACPGAEELIAYRAGELSAAEESRIQDHLLACPEDRTLLLGLERFVSGDPDAGETVSEIERFAVWRELERRIEARDSSRRRPAPWLQAVAASLAVAALGLSGWALTLRQSLAETSRPQLNAVVVDLRSGARRGAEDAVTVLALTPEDRLFTLVLPVWGGPDEELADEYVLEIVDSGGEPVWSDRGLRRNRYGSLSLTLSRRLLDAGDYRIRLFDAEEPRGEPAAEFALRIERAPEER